MAFLTTLISSFAPVLYVSCRHNSDLRALYRTLTQPQPHPLPHNLVHGPNPLRPPHPHLRRLLPRHPPHHAHSLQPQNLLLARRPLRHRATGPSLHHDNHADNTPKSRARQPAPMERGGAVREDRRFEAVGVLAVEIAEAVSQCALHSDAWTWDESEEQLTSAIDTGNTLPL